MSPTESNTPPRSERREIWANARVYGLGTIINRAAGFLLIPLYTRLLPASDFGLYAIVVVAAEVAGILLGGGFNASMVRVYLGSEDREHRRQVASTALIGFSLFAVVIALLARPAGALASHFFFDSPEHRLLFQLAFYGQILAMLFNLELDCFRVRKKPWAYLWLSACKSTLVLGLNLLFVAGLGMGVQGIVLGTLLSLGLISLSLIVHLLRTLGVRLKRTYLLEIVRLALPLVPAKCADISTRFADKFFLNRYFSAALVGNFALGDRIGSLLQAFVASPFAQIWIVRRLETLGGDRDQYLFARIFSQFLAVLVAAGLFLSLFAPEIVRIIGTSEYQGAARVVPLLSLSFVLMSIDMNFGLGILHARKTHLTLIASSMAAAANLLGMYLLVPSYGAIGAASAWVLTNSIRVGATAFLSLRVCRSNIRFEWGRSSGLLASAAAAYLVSLAWVGASTSVAASLVKSTLFCGYALAALFLVFLGSLEHLQTAGLMNHPVARRLRSAFKKEDSSPAGTPDR